MRRSNTARQGRRRRRRRNAVLQTRSVARPRIQTRVAGDRHRMRERRHFAERRRRLRVVQQRPQRRVAAGRRARHARTCATRACSGAAAAAAAPARSPTRQRRSPRVRPSAWSCSARSRRVSSAASARACADRRISGEFAHTIPYGLMSPAQMFAMKVQRFMHDHGVEQSALRAISLASYAHAQNNPRAVMYGRPLDAATLRRLALDRRAVPSVRLLPGERRRGGDGAGAGRTREGLRPPAVLRAVGGRRAVTIAPRRPCTTRRTTRRRRSKRWRRACSTWRRCRPRDVDVLQSYENFTGGVLMSIVEHGFCAPDEVNEFFTDEQPARTERQAAAQHERRQPGRVLHARPRV